MTTDYSIKLQRKEGNSIKTKTFSPMLQTVDAEEQALEMADHFNALFGSESTLSKVTVTRNHTYVEVE